MGSPEKLLLYVVEPIKIEPKSRIHNHVLLDVVGRAAGPHYEIHPGRHHLCTGHRRGVYGAYAGHVRGVYGACTGHVRGYTLEYTWHICGIYATHANHGPKGGCLGWRGRVP